MLTGPTLLLLLRAGDARATRRVLRVLERHGGDVSRTAGELGVSTDSLYRASRRDPAFGEAFRTLAMGRDGARARSAVARRQRSGRGVAGAQAAQVAQPGGTGTAEKK